MSGPKPEMWVTSAARVAELKELAGKARDETALLSPFVKMAGQKQLALLNNIIEKIEAL